MFQRLTSWLQLHRTPHSPAPDRPVKRPEPDTGTDSHPVQFRGVSIEDVIKAQNKWISAYNPLDTITIETVRRCLQQDLRGAYAEQQWIWEQMERYDPMMVTCVNKRETALKKFTGDVVIKQELSDRDQMLAEAQQRTIRDLINAINNMDEAHLALSQSSRRHYKFLQPYEDSKGLYLLPINNWLICRDGYSGAWQWNPTANFGATRTGIEPPVPFTDLVCRIHPRPVDLAAMSLVINRKITQAQWDVFLGRYGTPPLFLVMPPDISEELRTEYIRVAQQCVSNSAGVLPNGSDVKSAPVPATSVELFDRRLKVSNEEIVMLFTEGKLTILAESGSGTLAGGAHQDGWDDWGAGEADDIAGALTRGLVNRCLDQYHPGQPYLVEYALSRVETADPQMEIQSVTSLRSAGYDIPDEQVSQRTGWDVTSSMTAAELAGSRALTSPSDQMPWQTHRMPYDICRERREVEMCLALHRSSTLYAPARKVLEDRVAHRLAALDDELERATSVEVPLTAAETEEWQRLLALPNEGEITRMAEPIAEVLNLAVSGADGSATTDDTD